MLARLLLCALLGQALTQCVPRNYTLYAERDGCKYCVAVNTTICSGFCYSRDTNMKERGMRGFPIQRACVYQSLVYHTVNLPGCLPDVEPAFFFPVALRCHCSRCNTSYTECLHRGTRLLDPRYKPLYHPQPPSEAATSTPLTGE